MKRTHVLLPQPLLEQLKAQSKAQDVPVSELIRRAIDDYLKKQTGGHHD